MRPINGQLPDGRMNGHGIPPNAGTDSCTLLRVKRKQFRWERAGIEVQLSAAKKRRDRSRLS